MGRRLTIAERFRKSNSLFSTSGTVDLVSGVRIFPYSSACPRIRVVRLEHYLLVCWRERWRWGLATLRRQPMEETAASPQRDETYAHCHWLPVMCSCMRELVGWSGYHYSAVNWCSWKAELDGGMVWAWRFTSRTGFEGRRYAVELISSHLTVRESKRSLQLSCLRTTSPHIPPRHCASALMGRLRARGT